MGVGSESPEGFCPLSRVTGRGRGDKEQKWEGDETQGFPRWCDAVTEPICPSRPSTGWRRKGDSTQTLGTGL